MCSSPSLVARKSLFRSGFRSEAARADSIYRPGGPFAGKAPCRRSGKTLDFTNSGRTINPSRGDCGPPPVISARGGEQHGSRYRQQLHCRGSLVKGYMGNYNHHFVHLRERHPAGAGAERRTSFPSSATVHAACRLRERPPPFFCGRHTDGSCGRGQGNRRGIGLPPPPPCA